jgi:hypothetical protein
MLSAERLIALLLDAFSTTSSITFPELAAK